MIFGIPIFDNFRYVWFGNAYISNMYHKMITNKPTYFIDTGTIVNAGKTKEIYLSSKFLAILKNVFRQEQG